MVKISGYNATITRIIFFLINLTESDLEHISISFIYILEKNNANDGKWWRTDPKYIYVVTRRSPLRHQEEALDTLTDIGEEDTIKDLLYFIERLYFSLSIRNQPNPEHKLD